MFRKMTIALVAAGGLLVAPVLAQNSPHELSGGSSKAPPTSSQDAEKTDKTEKTEKLDTKSAEASEEKSEKSKSHGYRAASRHHHHHGAKHEASRHGHSALMRHRIPRAYGRARHMRPVM